MYKRQAAARACVAALCASMQLLEDDVGDESDWHAGALAGGYAALVAQTAGRAAAALADKMSTRSIPKRSCDGMFNEAHRCPQPYVNVF